MGLLDRTCKSETMNFERLFARLFVAVGGVFWVTAAIGANGYEPEQGDPWLIFGITVVALAIGWFYEYLAALLLAVGACAVVVWGVVADWYQTGGALLWWTMGGVLIAPMLISALLFMLAARMQRICTLLEARGASAPGAGAPST